MENTELDLTLKTIMPILEAPMQVALIIKHESGFKYYQQTHGIMCRHMEQEGVLMLVESDQLDTLLNKQDYCSQNTKKQSQIHGYIERIMQKQQDFENFTILDHPDNGEAWLHCEFILPIKSYYLSNHPEQRKLKVQAILTWANCD